MLHIATAETVASENTFALTAFAGNACAFELGKSYKKFLCPQHYFFYRMHAPFYDGGHSFNRFSAVCSQPLFYNGGSPLYIKRYIVFLMFLRNSKPCQNRLHNILFQICVSCVRLYAVRISKRSTINTFIFKNKFQIREQIIS